MVKICVVLADMSASVSAVAWLAIGGVNGKTNRTRTSQIMIVQEHLRKINGFDKGCMVIPSNVNPNVLEL
ncbi:hypothetical protein D3C85_1394510 [compost metagenome]